MKLSIYSYLFSNNEQYYLYNSETGFLAEISEKLFSQLYERDFNSLSVEKLKLLKEKHIIVEDDELYAYYYRMKMRFLSSAYNKEHIGLMIVPHTGCNFACPYCFEEKKRPQQMTEAIEDEIITFLEGHRSGKTISLTWYGGEPLLAFNNIQSLYYKIKEKTSLTIGYHSIITNGYLINDEILRFFKETHLNQMQITLDGCQEQHDSTRYLKGSKKGTYQQIINNIGRVLDELPICQLNIRININKKNKEDFKTMYDLLHEQFKGKRFHVYAGLIREETKDKNSLCYQSFQPEEVVSLYENIKAKGGNVDFLPHKTNKGCMMNKLNSYIIGPEGEIYKCWEDVGNIDSVIGYINRKELKNEPLFYRYMNEVSPFEDPACKDCLLFPVCTGGCNRYRYKNLFEQKHFNLCSPYKDKRNLETALLNSLKKCDTNQPIIRI